MTAWLVRCPLGGQPPAGLSGARGLAALKANFVILFTRCWIPHAVWDWTWMLKIVGQSLPLYDSMPLSSGRLSLEKRS
jgi:hypothetical protein